MFSIFSRVTWLERKEKVGVNICRRLENWQRNLEEESKGIHFPTLSMSLNFYIFPVRLKFWAKAHGPESVSPCLSPMWACRSRLNLSCIYRLWAIRWYDPNGDGPVTQMNSFKKAWPSICHKPALCKCEEYSESGIIHKPSSWSYRFRSAHLPTSIALIKVDALDSSSGISFSNWTFFPLLESHNLGVERRMGVVKAGGKEERKGLTIPLVAYIQLLTLKNKKNSKSDNSYFLPL